MASAPLLVVIDPTTDYQPALARAAALASHSRAPLVLLACLYDPYLAGERFYDGSDLKKLRKQLLQKQLDELQQRAEPLRNRGIQVTCRAVWDHPLHEAIIREALRINPHLVVKDTHHHPVLLRTLFSNTDWQLIRDCPFPLWLVKKMPSADESGVLAAVDPLHTHDKPAALDRRILDMAQEVGALLHEPVHLVHVYRAEPVMAALPMGAPVPLERDDELAAELRARHQAALDQLAASAGFPAAQVHLGHGHPAEVLRELAGRLRAGLIVMGAIARSRLKRAVLGNTAEQVLEWLPCDVLVVKPDGFSSPVRSPGRARGYLALVVGEP
jgi:universal stress protein E